MSTNKPKVIQLGEIEHAFEAWDKLAKHAEIVNVPPTITRADFLTQLKDPNSVYANAIAMTRTYGSVKQVGEFDQELINSLPPTLKSISHSGAGYNQIDVHACIARGIQVSNLPDLVNEATAITNIFLILAALRNFFQGNKLVLQGGWAKSRAAGAKYGNDVEGKILGILGMGGIGRSIRDKARHLGFSKIIYYNRSKLSEDLENGAEYVSFEELLKTADIISINVPLNKKTFHLIDKQQFKMMKDGVIIVNTARGPIVNEKELIKSLKEGKVKAAGLDVLETEPNVSKDFIGMDNVVILPHMGCYSVETQLKMESMVVENVFYLLHTGRVKTIVPEQKHLHFDCKPVLFGSLKGKL